MPEQIISASGTQYGMKVNSDGSINTTFVGDFTIGSVIVDAVTIAEEPPTAGTKINPRMLLQYSGTVIGSVWNFIGTGSYVQVLSYTGNNLTGVSSWQVV